MRGYPSTSDLLDPLVTLQHLDVRQGMRVGELGCGGHGHFVMALAKLVGPKGTVDAVDIQKTALGAITSRARHENIHNVKIIWSDLEMPHAPGLEPATLERAVLINTLSQAKQPERMLNTAHRLLKSDGLLLVVDWQMSATPLGPKTAHRLASADLEILAAKAGFNLKDKFSAGPHHYGYLFRRP